MCILEMKQALVMKITYQKGVVDDGVMVVVMEVDDEEEGGGWRCCCWCW